MRLSLTVIRSIMILGVLTSIGTGLAEAANRHVIVINDSSRSMVELNASNTGVDNWEEDLLGNGVLHSGQSIDANIDDGSGRCLFDLRAVMEDKSVATRFNFNVCTEESWRVTD